MRNFYLGVVIFLFITSAFSQENAYTSFDVSLNNSIKLNRFLINPAFSYARESSPTINLANKRQWVKFEDSPVLYLLNYQGRVSNESRFGIGAYMQSLGLLKNSGGLLNYSINVPMQNESNFTFGINTVFSSTNFDLASVITESPEPLLENQSANNIIGIQPGLNLNINTFDIGISAKNLIAYNLTTSETAKENSAVSYVGHIMYSKELSSYYTILDGSYLTVMAKIENTKDATDFSGNFLFDNPTLGWGEIGYSSTRGVNAGIGIALSEKFLVGYSYNLSINNSLFFGSSHEFSLAYKFTSYEDLYENRPVNRGKSSKKPNKSNNKASDKNKIDQDELRKKNAEKLKLEREAALKAKQEKERLAKEKAEQERLAREAAEKERLEKERLAKEEAENNKENANAEKERLEKERLAKEKAEKERLEKERLAKEAVEKERLEKERLAKERAERERLEKERLAKEAAEKELLEKERLAKDAAEKERLAKERAERERLEKERLAKEAAEKERLEKERLAKESAEKEKLEKERLEKEKAEREKLAKEAAEKERLEKERLAKEAAEKERLEKERLAKEAAEKERLEKERLAKEAAEKERLAKEAADRLEKERLEKERLAKETAEKERLEKERLAKERAEKERLAKEAAEKERLEKERLAKEAAEKAEKERLEKERLAKEAAEKERLEKERLAKERAEKERLAKEAAEKERLEKERLAREAAEKAEQERLAKEAAEKAEKERLAKEALNNSKLSVEDKITRIEDKLNVSNRLLDNYKREIAQKTKNSDKLIKRLDSLVKERDLDLKAYLSENDPNAKIAPRKFVSTMQQNAQLNSIKSEIAANKKIFDELINDFESANRIRLEELKAQGVSEQDANELNKHYKSIIEDLKNKRQQYIQFEKIADDRIKKISADKEEERLRRIKKAEYDTEQQRILNTEKSLQDIKNTTSQGSNTTIDQQTDTGEDQNLNDISIIKKQNGVQSGYYVVLGKFKDITQRDNFVRQVVAGGGTNVKLFYNIYDATYYVYIDKFDELTPALKTLKDRGTKPYNKRMSIISVE